jgi:hypothetical protein
MWVGGCELGSADPQRLRLSVSAAAMHIPRRCCNGFFADGQHRSVPVEHAQTQEERQLGRHQRLHKVHTEGDRRQRAGDSAQRPQRQRKHHTKPEGAADHPRPAAVVDQELHQQQHQRPHRSREETSRRETGQAQDGRRQQETRHKEPQDGSGETGHHRVSPRDCRASFS